MSFFRIAAIVLTCLALICAVGPSTIIGADWPVWFLASFLALLLEAVPLNIGRV